MILTDPAELAQYLPNHVLQNLDNMSGFFAISESDFLSERIGRPLLEAMQQRYTSICPVLTASMPEEDSTDYPWCELILLCQPLVAFDAFHRAADIQAVSVNQGGINIAETGGYDIAPDKFIASYKAQCLKEAHAASNRLLIKLEEWQQRLAPFIASLQPCSAPSSPADFGSIPASAPAPATAQHCAGSTSPADFGSPSSLAPDGGDPSPSPSYPIADLVPSPADAERVAIVNLWRQSAYYFYIEGLLFSTARQFGAYVNIYDSREKFIHLVPDIRYCQETHIEAEVGDSFLYDLIERARTAQLSRVEEKAYHMLQRTLSLYVEARAPMFSSRAQQARDEAAGYMALTLRYIREHHLLDRFVSSVDTPDDQQPTRPCPMHTADSHQDRCHCSGRRAPGFLTSSLI